ncbi:MAG: endopeptidase La [Balneolaceae bacterium]|nr:endopeptidase La [Balneolaceae bacterium]MBO6546572.1 endopeptidase La [Balneolaceae bacterium]MBO6648931.1 endopeptidase La [Balneolaceae bacterium]
MKTRLDLFNELGQSDDEFEDFEQAIPLMSEEEEKALTEALVPDSLPILPLKNTVLFPGVVVPITVGRDRSLALVKEAYAGDKTIGVVTQKDMDVEEPEYDDLHRRGTVAQILKLIKMPDGSRSIVIQGKSVFEVQEFTQDQPYFKAKVTTFPKEMDIQGLELDASVRNVKETAVDIINKSPNIPSEAAVAVNNINSPTFLLNFIASNLNVDLDDKQGLLETQKFSENLEKIMEFLEQELQVLDMSEKIRTKVKSDIDDQQREFYLRQQMKAIQEELGEGAEQQDVEKLRKKLEEKLLPEHAKEVAEKELQRLEMTPNASPNYGIIHSYVEWILDLPWEEFSEDKLDLEFARKVLDEDHYGLEKVKKRIVEYLAVLKLKKDMKAPILCFYGPPGVGKTSLGKSIARALNREFERFSLGGIRDEAEIRGHRRTYIGALPGRIIRSMKKAGKGNPVIMLDEIDKVGADYRGDPTSALLEVLDPEQNDTFSDNYLELEYDLSKVLFIATANSLETIPAPLRDRMEIINISGYTLEEKTEIAKKYLIPKQVKENGLKAGQIEIEDAAIERVIDEYTRESGVRNLDRQVGAICRGVAAKVASGELEEFKVSKSDVEDFLGKQKFFSDVAERTTVPGVATGLAWTPFGGDILFIEASVSKGSGKLNITGQLGDVMKESAMLAISYLKAHAENIGIPEEAFKYWDLHIHVPAGAVPKDGPSAGVSLMSAIASIFTQRKVKGTVALTGEITLRGMVLPVGGIKEKVLAAKRAGIKKVLLPKKNEKDVADIEEDVIGDLEVQYLERMESLLDIILEKDSVNEPSDYFKVSDAHKSAVSGKNGKAEEVKVN